jgi:hypothetical protein
MLQILPIEACMDVPNAEHTAKGALEGCRSELVPYASAWVGSSPLRIAVNGLELCAFL